MDNKFFLQELLRQKIIIAEQAKQIWQEHHIRKQPIHVALKKHSPFTTEQIEQFLQQFQISSSQIIETQPQMAPKDILQELEAISSSNTAESKTLPNFPQKIDSSAQKTMINQNNFSSESLPPAQNLKHDPPKDRYTLLKKIGEGGMGVVLSVEDTSLKRKIALKKIKTNTHSTSFNTQQQSLIARFQREAEIMAQLEHPNIVPLYDFQKDEEGNLFFTMRQIEGESLRDALKRQQKEEENQEEEAFLDIFIKVCDAVSYAHSKGIIHRDLKPENIMLGPFGEVYILDWGIAKSKTETAEQAKLDTRSESQHQTIGGIGTRGYMGPEQEENAANVSPQSDIYALGKILRECFTYLNPTEELHFMMKHYQKNRPQTSQKITTPSKNLLDQKIPKDVLAIIQKATQDDPKKRYRSVPNLLQDLERYRKNLRLTIREYTLLETLQKWLKRNQKIILLGIFFFLCFFLTWSYFSWKILQQKETRFLKASQKATGFWNTWQQSPNLSTGQKIEFLLKSLNEWNQAISVKPNIEEYEQEKLKVTKELVALTCITKDYQMAQFITKELESLQHISSIEKENLKAQILKSEGALLAHNQERLQFWLNQLKTKLLNDEEQEEALFEISQMKEKEIFDIIVKNFKEGVEDYFLTETKENTNQKQRYEIMAKILGKMGQAEAARVLLETLTQINQFVLKKQSISLYEIEAMILLAKSLKYLKQPGTAIKLYRITQQWTENSLFYNRVFPMVQKLFEIEDLSRLNLNIVELTSIQIFQEHFQEAIQNLSALIQQKPEEALYYRMRGDAYTKIKKYQKAIEDYTKAIQLNRTSKSAPYIQRALVYSKLKHFNESFQDFNFMLQIDPNNFEGYFERGNLKRDSLDFVGALEDYNSALKINPSSADTYYSRGNVKRDIGNYKEALEDFSNAIQFNPKPPFYNNRGALKMLLEDFLGALDDFDNAIKKDPTLYLAYYNKGRIYFKFNSYQEAFDQFSKCITINPNYEDAYIFRAKIILADEQEDLNLFQVVEQNLSHVIQLNNTLSEAFYLRGLAKYKQNKPKEARIDFIEYLKLTQQIQEPVHLQYRQEIFRLFPDLSHSK